MMRRRVGVVLLTLAVLLASGCAPAAGLLSDLADQLASTSAPPAERAETGNQAGATPSAGGTFRYEDIPAYSGQPYVAVNNNIPFFTEAETEQIPANAWLGDEPEPGGVQSFEVYSDLDHLGRCGAAFSSVGLDIMPTEKRGDIYEVHPSGWVQNTYDFVDGEALYNRCHLLGYQLTAENANEENLITGTRYFNTEGMLPFENMVADYVHETGNHVLYRVTPVFVGNELLARGVLMEARSVEDNGEGVEYCTFCYNVQPGVVLDYVTGENWLESEDAARNEPQHYVLNTGTQKFHRPSCESVEEINPARREDYTGTRASLIEMGYKACGACRP